jgi:NADPH:quinone reductase-like Zn-dependent oxidoreductase
MTTQTVFRLTSRESFEGLQAFTEPIPPISKSEVLIKIRSIALNFRDVAIATSTYPLPVKDDVIPCSDMAGSIIAIGDSVTDFAIGERVIAPLNPSYLYGGTCKDVSQSFGGPIDGMLREYIVLPAHALVRIPESSASGFGHWASLVCAGSTAWNAFYGNKALKPGDTVLLLGISEPIFILIHRRGLGLLSPCRHGRCISDGFGSR